MALIGEDATVTFQFGSISSGGVLTWGGTLTTFTGKARRISVDDSVELANTKAIGDSRKKHRPHSGSTRIDLEGVVGFGGYAFPSSQVTPIGQPCRLIIKELSSLSTPMTYIGIVEHWKGEIQSGEAQIESMSIMCDGDYL